MFRICVASLIVASLANAECYGEKFFKTTSKHFLPGLQNVCFQSNEDQTLKSIKESLPVITDSLRKWQGKYSPKQEAWTDNLAFQDWFNDGGFCCFGNVYYKAFDGITGIEAIKPLNSSIFGISSVYIGNKQREDTNVVFTLYTGEATNFRRYTGGVYSKMAPVNGMFDITISTAGFTNRYFTHIMDSLGFKRPCTKQTTVNCAEYNGAPSGLIVLATSDKNVKIVMDAPKEKVHIRFNVDMNSLPAAMTNNLRVQLAQINYLRNKVLDGE